MDTPTGMKDSIPAWIKYSVQYPGEIPYTAIYYDPPEEVLSLSSPSPLSHGAFCHLFDLCFAN